MSRDCYATPEKMLNLQSRVLLLESRQPLFCFFFHRTDFTQSCYLQVYSQRPWTHPSLELWCHAQPRSWRFTAMESLVSARLPLTRCGWRLGYKLDVAVPLLNEDVNSNGVHKIIFVIDITAQFLLWLIISRVMTQQDLYLKTRLYLCSNAAAL